MPPKRKKGRKPKPPRPGPEPPKDSQPQGPSPPVGRLAITRTNGSQFIVVEYPQPEGPPKKADRTYDIVEDEGVNPFISLHIRPAKYNKLCESSDNITPVFFRTLPPAGSFITLRYNKGKGAAATKTGPQDQDFLTGPPGDSTSYEFHSYQSVEAPSPADATSTLHQKSAPATTQQTVHAPAGLRHKIPVDNEQQSRPAPPETSQASGDTTTASPQAPPYSPITPAELTTPAIGNSINSLPLQQQGQQQVAAVTTQADLPQPPSEQPQTLSQTELIQQPVTSGPLFAASPLDQAQSDLTNTSGRRLRSRSRSTTPQLQASPVKKRKIVRLKVPEGYKLDENMAAVRDPHDVSNVLKGVVDDLYDVQSKTHGFIPETQNLLIDKIGDLTDKLAHLKDLTDPQLSPNNPIHNVRIAPEIVDYVDEGRNPDIFTREFVENVQRGNAVINGKKQAFKDFSVIYAQKLKEGIGGVDRQVDRIMHNAGLDKELEQAMQKSREAAKDPSKERENGEK